ncbi:MAG: smtA [Solirubrobacterales bacterium]|nr:smtA [Solirubrobacterales bacterium]
MSEPPEPALHPLVSGFVDAETYDRGRPRYSAEVVRVLSDGLGLADGAPVLELGAGAGALSGALLASGLDVTAVEPLDSMRSVLALKIGDERVLQGVAEQIPLPDGSVDGVLAADAFHWFDEQRALPEIRRVLTAGGGVGILRTLPVLDRPWAVELGALVTRSRQEHPAFGDRGAAAALEEDAAFGPVLEQTVTTTRTSDREGLVAWIASFSWIATLDAEERGELLESVDALLRRNGVEQLRHDVRHQIWMARLRPQAHGSPPRGE